MLRISHKRRRSLAELLAHDSLSLRPRHVTLAGQQQIEEPQPPAPPPPARNGKKTAPTEPSTEVIIEVDGDCRTSDLVAAFQMITRRNGHMTVRIDAEVAHYLVSVLLASKKKGPPN